MDCIAEVVIKQFNNLLPMTTETLAGLVLRCEISLSCMAKRANLSTDPDTTKLEKVGKKTRKKIKGIERFLSKKQLNSREFFDCKTNLSGI